MTREQTYEVDKVIPLLDKCRQHLDNAMYRMGEISDEDVTKLRSVYDHICKALDIL